MCRRWGALHLSHGPTLRSDDDDVANGLLYLQMRSADLRVEPQIGELRDRAKAAGRPEPEVVLMTSLPVGDPAEARDRARELAAIGVSRLVHGWRYAEADEFRRHVEVIADHVRPAVMEASP